MNSSYMLILIILLSFRIVNHFFSLLCYVKHCCFFIQENDVNLNKQYTFKPSKVFSNVVITTSVHLKPLHTFRLSAAELIICAN